MQKQFNSPVPIRVERKPKMRDLNYVEARAVVRKSKGATSKRKRPNVIRVRLEDNAKDIVIRFADKETLIKSLREMFNI